MESTALLGYVSAGSLVPHLDVFHHVVVFRVVDAECRTDGQPVLQHVLRIQVTAVRVVRPHAVRRIQIVRPLPVRHDVDGSAQGVRAEPRGHHALVYLDMVYQVHGQISQRHLRTLRVQGNTVQEVAHRIARHAVNRQVEIAAYTAFLADLHTRRTVHNAVQVRQRTDHRVHIDGVHRQSALTQLLRLRLADDRHILQRHRVPHLALALLLRLCRQRQTKHCTYYYNKPFSHPFFTFPGPRQSL